MADAAWAGRTLTWLLLSEGAGFKGGAAAIEVTGPPGLAFSSGVINGAKFHHGQIVGSYELPKDASVEAAQAYLDSKRFALTPVEPGGVPGVGLTTGLALGTRL